MNIVRTQTSTGAIISFDRHSGYAVEKNGPIKLSQELVQVMFNASKLFIENPMGKNIERMWVVGGKKLYDKPDKNLIARISEGEEE